MDDKLRRTITGDCISENEKFLKLTDVAERCAISKSMVYKLMDDFKFPPCHRITKGRVFWLATDINTWRSMTPEHFHNQFGEQLKAQAEGAAA
ncbi:MULTISPECIES: helix-turn-helix transcriptional regulator [unclassified Pseudoalteromonas]|uniref:helix-turn-helix transcriptional regulator n=1 Tax=unclassified Pseudoalteromonas TaxID=194690 RepID=UPI003868F08E